MPFTAQTRMSGANVDGRQVRKGATDAVVAWVKEHGGDVPGELDPIVEAIARGGGTPLVVADGARALGVVQLKDIVKGGMRDRFDQLRRMGIRTVMVTGDNPLTAAAIASEAGVDDFLAQATPERKLELIRAEQGGGKLVAMIGDGTNDAPALAQADVGVAMNTRHAGRQGGRQHGRPRLRPDQAHRGRRDRQAAADHQGLADHLLDRQRRGQVLRHHPGAVRGHLPGAGPAQRAAAGEPTSAVLSAVIFNALIIVALIPLALRGVRFRPVTATALLRRNLLVYGLGGIMLPFIGIKLIDLAVNLLRLA